MKIAKRMSVYLGASAFHLNRPAISFLGDKNVKLNMKFVGHGGFRFPIKGRFDMQPKFIFMSQGKSLELILGTDFRILFEERYPDGNHFKVGAMFRMVGGDPNAPWRDKRMVAESVVLNAGIVWNGLELGVAYDINVSQLISGSKSQGGFEVGPTVENALAGPDIGKLVSEKAGLSILTEFPVPVKVTVTVPPGYVPVIVLLLDVGFQTTSAPL
jgi:hypothetical protein